MRRAATVLVAVLLFAVCALPEKKPEQYADLTFTVLNAKDGKPVRNAAVVLHVLDKRGKAVRDGIELKTHPDGKTNFSGAPYGKLLVQVIAHGFQTFGQDFDVDRPTQEIVIKLNRPQHQYSIYK